MSQAKKAAVMMGSASDMPIMGEAIRQLDHFKVEYLLQVTSAHRTPKRTFEFIERAEAEGVGVFIIGAGMAAHLAGVVAAHTTRPVIGVPTGGLLGGLDALLSTVQMPKGIPVATVAVGKAGAVNAGILACQILAGDDEELRARLASHRQELAEQVAASEGVARDTLANLLG